MIAIAGKSKIHNFQAWIMDIAQLRQFVLVADKLNLSHAAEAMNLTQPALSKSMHRLQRELGTSIYVRRGRGIQLTECGEALVRHAKLIDSQLRDARAEVSALAGGERGYVRVGAGPAWLSRYLPLAISRILRSRSAVRFAVEAGFPDQLIKRLRQGDLDVVLAGLPDNPVDPDLQCIRLSDDRVCVIARAGHPLARTRHRNLADYAKYSWILPGREVPVRQRLEQAFADHKIAPPLAVVETDSLSLILSTLRLTDCLGFATSQALTHSEARGIVSVDHPALSFRRDSGIIHRRPGGISAAAGVLIDQLGKIALRYGNV
jgi:DNA-binding transcriptional LysR family regulator